MAPEQTGAAPNDPAIPNAGMLWRRLPWSETADDESNLGQRRASSGGFDDSKDGSGMSAHLVQPGEDVGEFLRQQKRERDGVAELSVFDVREKCTCGIRRQPDETDPHHVEVTSRPGLSKKKKSRCLYGIARLIRQPLPPLDA